MSYKIKNFSPSNNKETLKKVDFESKPGQITNVYLEDEKQKSFKKIILGRQKNKTGRYQVDNEDVINKNFIKLHTEYIKTDTWFERLVPTKWILALSLLSDLQFLRNARIKYAEKKYEYLSLLDSKNDLSDLKLRRDIDEAINKFIKFSNESHEKIINNLDDVLSKLNEGMSQKMFNEFSPQVKVLSKALFDIEKEKLLKRMEFKFVQVLYDRIESLNELRDSCTCEFNTKKSNNKLLRKRKNLFEYKQTKFIVEKQLKFLNIRLNKLRLESILLIFRKRTISTQFKFELDKFYKTYSVAKEVQQEISSELNNWKKVIKDKVSDQNLTEKKFLFNFIKTESSLLTKFIISNIHNYHKLILTGEVKYGNKNEFLSLRKHYKKQIVPVFKQAELWMENNFKNLDINFEWFLKGSFKLTSLNMIYVKILKAINLGKKNIILSDFLHLLTNKDYEMLFDTISKINEFYPEISFIILHSRTFTISDISKNKKIYWSRNNELVKTTNKEFFEKNLIDICKNELGESNVFSYTKESDNLIDVENRLWNVNTKKFNESGFIFINPLEISTEFIENNSVPINVRVIRTNKYHDKNMYFGITKNKTKIYFYSEDKTFERENEAVLYFEEHSISAII
ncbi:hypothetical protein mflW37_6790 [Mesoplasma florum W37]|uniref:Uncharacterized protein n=1 Tax=Mesoplasma florum TaxID=2151 RepID=A0AAD0MNI2_MESFO|nr:hypothetical protein [Mesoplasma florum]AGY41746.1 hypothetical protein mflW37_6790 [Mesoplasma florum W37]AVN59951.1 hypothetical protein CG008_03580 [Mesoplasma florum]AVN66085.1 hypothetical protein MflW12_6800 [Mesoplasma florum]